MKKAICSLFIAGLAWLASVQTNLITNASFESGLTGWNNVGSAVRSISLPGHTGTNALRLTSRAGLVEGVQTVNRTGALRAAKSRFEVGLMVEGSYPNYDPA